jgi:hypothetical protein
VRANSKASRRSENQQLDDVERSASATCYEHSRGAGRRLSLALISTATASAIPRESTREPSRRYRTRKARRPQMRTDA